MSVLRLTARFASSCVSGTSSDSSLESLETLETDGDLTRAMSRSCVLKVAVKIFRPPFESRSLESLEILEFDDDLTRDGQEAAVETLELDGDLTRGGVDGKRYFAPLDTQSNGSTSWVSTSFTLLLIFVESDEREQMDRTSTGIFPVAGG